MTPQERDDGISALRHALREAKAMRSAALGYILRYRPAFQSVTDICSGCQRDAEMQNVEHVVPDYPARETFETFLRDLRHSNTQIAKCRELLQQAGEPED